jgi:AcrR family transcriptional regulator
MARPRLHDAALRERLLAETSAVIGERGAAAVTVRDVAARAGTSASAVYSLFGGREALVRAAGDDAFAGFAARLAAAPRSGDPGADLLAIGLAYRAHALAEPRLYRLMFSTAGAGAQDPRREAPQESAAFAALRDAVAAVLAAPSPAAGTADHRAGAEEPALALWALVHGLVELELAGLLPGTADRRAARYAAALRAAGPALLGAPAPV